MSHYFGAWKKYAVFTGRATRTEYWMFTLFNVIISALLYIPVVMNEDAGGDPAGFGVLAAMIYLVYALAVFLPSISLTVRRLHDIGRTGAWIFVSFVPLVGGIALLVFTLTESQAGDNEYGPGSVVDAEIFA